jgi:hypothetical protein
MVYVVRVLSSLLFVFSALCARKSHDEFATPCLQLHYKETEFQTSPGSTVKDLIAINNHLQQPEAAIGILKVGSARALVTFIRVFFNGVSEVVRVFL